MDNFFNGLIISEFMIVILGVWFLKCFFCGYVFGYGVLVGYIVNGIVYYWYINGMIECYFDKGVFFVVVGEFWLIFGNGCI